jgi:ATPase subunit of ABC transporter with duplicated ATPase domains
MIVLSRLGKSYGERTLFDGVSLQLQAGARYGLVGANGSGKTTLLAILAGDDHPSEGSFVMPSGARVGLLRQDRSLSGDELILHVAMMGDEAAWAARSHKERLLEESADAAAIAEAEERVLATDGYSLESRAAMVLEGLGIETAAHRRPMTTLSGGFQLRVLLARTLLGTPELLLLDEPTNHLDILTVSWLEEFLATYPGCVVIVSHDHRFLDNVASHVLDIDYETVTLYHGNYRAFVEQKQRTREQKEQEIEKKRQAIEHKKAFVERFRAKNTKARQAQSRLKQIERIEIEPLPETSRRAPTFDFQEERASGRDVLEARRLCKAFGARQVLSDVDVSVRRGERVAVIGGNGLGKSTLLRILTGRLEADGGEVRWGHEARVGYFAQDHHELLTDARSTVLDYLWEICPEQGTSFVRGQLGKLLFSGDDVDKRLGALSGGEAARLIFSRLLVQKPNVLLLDEPTNHLDLEAIEALADSLSRYRGTLLFVSHDRWFVSKLATRVIEVKRDGIVDYPGSYDEYLARAGHDHLDAATVIDRSKKDKAAERAAQKAAAPGGGWHAQKAHKSQHRKLLSERARVTAAIEAAEARAAAIQTLYCQPGFFDVTSKEELGALELEKAALEPRIAELMVEWETIELALEELGDPG